MQSRKATTTSSSPEVVSGFVSTQGLSQRIFKDLLLEGDSPSDTLMCVACGWMTKNTTMDDDCRLDDCTKCHPKVKEENVDDDALVVPPELALPVDVTAPAPEPVSGATGPDHVASAPPPVEVLDTQYISAYSPLNLSEFIHRDACVLNSAAQKTRFDAAFATHSNAHHAELRSKQITGRDAQRAWKQVGQCR